MARALVIGGTLFIGRALVARLLERGDEVVIMHRGATHPYGSRVTDIRCDRNDVAAVRAALHGERFDVVYDNVYDWQRGTTAEQVMAAALAVRPGLDRYVFTSSVAVYPPGGGERGYDEDDALVPSDGPNPYGAQKADSERALFALHREGRVSVATLRPAFVYGPHNAIDREAFFWDRIRDGRPVIVPGDGTDTMQFVHAGDVAEAAIRAGNAAAANGRAYNLGGAPVTQSEFVRLLARVAGREVELVHVPRERLHAMGGQLMSPPLYYGTYLDVPPITVRGDRAREELGFELRGLEEGMRETYAWWQEQDRPRPDYAWEDRVLSGA